MQLADCSVSYSLRHIKKEDPRREFKTGERTDGSPPIYTNLLRMYNPSGNAARHVFWSNPATGVLIAQ
jgi:hypothetical protein